MYVVYLAQALTAASILERLKPNSIWDIFLYPIFFLGLITMFMQSDKTIGPTILMAAVSGMAVIAKLGVLEPKELGSLLINAGMFTLPLIVAGITKAPKSRGPAILTGILGGLYFFGFWLIAQRS